MLNKQVKEQGAGGLDTRDTNKITLILLGILLLLIFMDSQARRHYNARGSAQEEVLEKLESLRSPVATLEEGIAPIRQSAQDILGKPLGQELHTNQRLNPPDNPPELPPRETSLPVRDGQIFLYFIRFTGGTSTLVRVRRPVSGSSINAISAAQLLQRGPLSAERGLLNTFDAGMKIKDAWVDNGIVVLDLSESVGSNSAHIIKDRMDQLAYTFSGFAGIQGVRILVNGHRPETLGAARVPLPDVLRAAARRTVNYP